MKQGIRVSGALCTEYFHQHAVYIISRDGRLPLKVGFSARVGHRLHSFRTYANGGLFLHALIRFPDIDISESAYAHIVEGKLHRMLADEGVDRMPFWDKPKSKSEWFDGRLSVDAFVTLCIRYCLDVITPSPEHVDRWNSDGAKVVVYRGQAYTQTRSGRWSKRAIQAGTTDTYLGTHRKTQAPPRT